MPRLRRDDGTELFWEERGEGPLVVIAQHWNGVPLTFGPLIEDLAVDHRVVRYDTRGTDESARTGPHDIATTATDLGAVVEAAGGDGATVVGILDGCNRAVRTAAERPDLIASVVGVAAFPATRGLLEGTDSMIGSRTVMETLLEMLETDYRGAMRTLINAGNAQMTEDEVRARVQAQVEYCPHEVALARFRAYVEDDPRDASVALGRRLSLLYSPQMASGWFPPLDEMVPLVTGVVPEAAVEEIEDGIVTRPELTAGAVRRARAATAPGVS